MIGFRSNWQCHGEGKELKRCNERCKEKGRSKSIQREEKRRDETERSPRFLPKFKKYYIYIFSDSAACVKSKVDVKSDESEVVVNVFLLSSLKAPMAFFRSRSRTWEQLPSTSTAERHRDVKV